MKRWHAVLSALLFFTAPVCRASEDLTSAARDLARKTAGWGIRSEPVSVAWRNLSSLGSSELAQARDSFDAGLEDAGCRVVATSAVSLKLTLSETPAQFLLVEEAQKGEEHRVFVNSWKRAPGVKSASARTVLSRRLLREQDERILDAAVSDQSLLVLTPGGVAVYGKSNGEWALTHTAALPASRVWPRDVRGRIALTGDDYQVNLPGYSCHGNLQTAAFACEASEEPWLFDSNARALLLAAFAPGRNYFDGRLTLQTGAHKTIAPFYTAAAALDDRAKTVWLTSTVEGRVQVYNAALEPTGSASGWGSDLAAIAASCGARNRTLILGTRAADGSEPDAIQAYAIVEGSPAPVGSPLMMEGAVTALWSAGAGSAIAVVRDPASGRFAAYSVSAVCGE